MRREFSLAIEKYGEKDERIIFLTGDVGFMALENVRNKLKDRFINMGVAEQNLIAVAAGLASENLIPVCYSIAPFIVFRAIEHIRLDVCLHNMNVKLVGNGGGYGYGIMGATHHALEDIAVLSCMPNIKCFIPFCNEDVESAVKKMLECPHSVYLRLGYGNKPADISLAEFSPIRKVYNGNKITIITLGPIVLNVFNSLKIDSSINDVDIFVVSELPLVNLSEELIESVKRTKKIIVIEEHCKRGGLAENLALLLLEKEINCKIIHLFAKGYPDGTYGSQKYHQKKSELDEISILNNIKKILYEK
ncbi:MAG TPA: transketolase C-terminal domain-containing protein [bacterium]|nr:transketolase C-terminal domain-containing protein [bacterium]HPQ19474.1 transketolase C-terminal domain-containing protein [bacterium]